MYAFLKQAVMRPLLYRLVGIVSLFMVIQPIMAQDTPVSVDITGTINAIAQNTLIVDEIVVDISHATVTVPLAVGMTVRVQGNIQNEIVSAVVIEVVEVAVTPEVTQSPGDPTDSDVIIVIEGPVRQINVNIITIYNFDVTVEVNHPILSIIKVGDFVRVNGNFASNGLILATSVINIIDPTNTATVQVSGNIQSISGSSIVVNGVNIQFDPDDPSLTTLHIGDFISVEGNFQRSGTTIVLVVVNIYITNVPTTLPENCKITKNGKVKCSKKKKS